MKNRVWQKNYFKKRKIGISGNTTTIRRTDIMLYTEIENKTELRTIEELYGLFEKFTKTILFRISPRACMMPFGISCIFRAKG
jgi:hypothetical protein